MYYQETGIKIPHRYEYDLRDITTRKQNMEEFVFYRKKFEKSQRALGTNQVEGDNYDSKLGLNLNKDMFDPRKMQQQI